MPENEMWTYNRYNQLEGRIRQLGVNLGAAGDRRGENGTMWLEWPSVGGESPEISIEVQPEQLPCYRRHAVGYNGVLPWVASSWVGDLESITINLNYGDAAKNPPAKQSGKYTLRLFFAEPEDLQPGQRLFDVVVADQPPIENLDIVKEAGAPRRGIVKEMKGIVAQDKITVTLKSKTKPPFGALLCGFELIPEP